MGRRSGASRRGRGRSSPPPSRRRAAPDREPPPHRVCPRAFDRATHLTDVEVASENRVQQDWTLEWVAGPRMADIPVYILLNKLSYSSAEHLAFALQQAGGAVVIGERTRGGAHAVTYLSFPQVNLNIRVPYTTDVAPDTRATYVIGVVPDVAASTGDAFAAANVRAISDLLETETAGRKRFVLEWQLARSLAELQPVALDEPALSSVALPQHSETPFRPLCVRRPRPTVRIHACVCGIGRSLADDGTLPPPSPPESAARNAWHLARSVYSGCRRGDETPEAAAQRGGAVGGRPLAMGDHQALGPPAQGGVAGGAGAGTADEGKAPLARRAAVLADQAIEPRQPAPPAALPIRVVALDQQGHFLRRRSSTGCCSRLRSSQFW